MARSEQDIIDEQWSALLVDKDPHIRRIASRAVQEPKLKELFPFASHSDLRFSRALMYPYDVDLPFVLTTPSGEYEARAEDNRILGRGDLDLVIGLVVDRITATGRR